MDMNILAIVYSFVIMLIQLEITLSQLSVIITTGPQDTTVCMNTIAECDCGFTEADPHLAIPNWRIVLRSDNGSIISNNTIDGRAIVSRPINGLQWAPDLTSGDDNAPNSKLLVGPVNMTHNQSSYQCIFELIGRDPVISSMGTMTVVDPLSVIINMDEICTTSIAITLNTINHQTCGDVSHNVTISGRVIYPDTVGGPIAIYAINELESNRLYSIAVLSMHNSSSRIVKKSVRTSAPKSPNPIDVNSIEMEKINNNSCRLTWKPPVADKCSMLPVHYYHVRVISREREVISEQKVNAATLMFKHLESQLNITFTVNITVVDIKGLKSTSSVSTKTISNSEGEESNNESDETNESGSLPVIIIVVVAVILIGLSVLIIIILTYLKYRHLHKSHDITFEKKTKDNSYIETQDESRSHDVASPYAISGPSTLLTDSIQSNNNEDETAHEPMTHNDDELDEDESTPPIPPKQLNYAEIQLTSEVPKCMTTDHHVAYAETKPA